MKKSLRFAALNRDAFTCRYCGRSAPDVRLEVDHVTPRAASGSDALANLVTACYECNRGKRHYLLTRGARMVLEDDQPSEYADWIATFVLAEQAFSNAIAEAYEAGLRDSQLRDQSRSELGPLSVGVILSRMAGRAERVQ